MSRSIHARTALGALGAALLFGGLATVMLEHAAAAGAATGANFVATGHDMDFHCAGGGTEGDFECAYLKIVVGKVRNGSTKPILALDHGTEVAQALAKTGQGPVVTVDPDDSGALDGVSFLSGGAPRYSAVIVASDSTCGGCDNDPTGEANINARKGDIKAFFNAGGGILALAGAEDRDTFYDFVPLTGLSATAVTNPFTVTAAGTALGITSDMANCCATHNSFEIPSKPLVVLETDTAGKAETIGAFNVSIGGGGFTSPPPSSSPPSSPSPSSTTQHAPTSVDQSVTTPENTPVDITLTGSDPDGDTIHFAVVRKTLEGTLTGSGTHYAYTPNSGFVGNDFFTFTVSDATHTSIQHVVNIDVLAPGATSPPPLASTGSAASENLNLGLALVALGAIALLFGFVRVPRLRRRH